MLATAAGASANNGGAGGCSAGFELISVAEAVSAGYVVAQVADQTGNNDGYACRRELGRGLLVVYPNAPVDTIYKWADNAEPQTL
jgi:hypothetical protein